jgi:signal peptidase I
MLQLFINPTKYLRKKFYNFYYRIFSSFNKRESLAKSFADNTETVLVALLLALFIRGFIIATFLIPSGSMENTLLIGDRMIGTRFDFIFRDPKIGEIIIFKDPVHGQIRLIKRLIGKEGDKIEIKNKILYINDIKKDEPFLKDDTGIDFGPVTVPKDHFFVMGDNRNNSKDSRLWNLTYEESFMYLISGYKYWEKHPEKVGFFHRKFIESRPILRFWPLNRIGVVQ